MIKEQQKQDDSVSAPPQVQNQGSFFKGQTALAQNAVPPSGQTVVPGGLTTGSPGGLTSPLPMQAGSAGGGTMAAPLAQQTQAAPPSVDMDNERRAYVESLMEYIKTAAQNMQVSKVDGAMLDKMLKAWMEMFTKAEDIISKIGSEKAAGPQAPSATPQTPGATHQTPGAGTPATGDPVLLVSLQKSFASAIRTLFVQASKVTKKPLIRLFLDNSSKLPAWAWPDSGLFTGGEEKDKRAFVADFATALRDTALFGAYGTLDRPKLEEILGRLNTLVDGAQVMIAGQLNNDNNLRNDLRTAYSGAVKNLLMTSAPQLGSSLFKLYMEYRFGPKAQLIHEWADEQFANITAPVPQGTGGPDPITGEVTFTLNGFNVIIKPDGVKAGTGGGGETTTDPHYRTPGFAFSGGVVTSVDSVGAPTVAIQSFYQADASKSGGSGYGRGTTDQDVKHGDTTLAYHEGSHAKDFISYINSHPAPTFGGKVGQTVGAFHTAATQYQRAMATYFGTLNRSSELLTDCVGKPTIEDYHKAQGTVSPVRCP